LARFLGAAVERGDFGEVGEPAGLLQHGEATGGADGFLGPFGPFSPDAFHGEFAAGGLNLAAKGDGFGSELQVEAGGELKGPQHAQRVLDEGGAGVAEDAGA
jgi:hypothetical protein